MVRLYLFCITAEDDYHRVPYSPARPIVDSQFAEPPLALGDKPGHLIVGQNAEPSSLPHRAANPTLLFTGRGRQHTVRAPAGMVQLHSYDQT
jgi:hypothetical protein